MVPTALDLHGRPQPDHHAVAPTVDNGGPRLGVSCPHDPTLRGSRPGREYFQVDSEMLMLEYCHFVEDTEGYDMELRFIRDTDKREVDLVVLRDGRAELVVECKSGERSASPACRYFRERTDIPRFYQVHTSAPRTMAAQKPTPAFCRSQPFVTSWRCHSSGN